MSRCVFELVVTTLTAFADGDDRAAYRAAAVKAGKDAGAPTRLALWCEARGFLPERDRELTEALRLNPNHAEVRGLSGMVHVEGRWVKPDDVAAQAEANPALPARVASNVALVESGSVCAGESAVLVHDNGIFHPPVKPFDAVGGLDP